MLGSIPFGVRSGARARRRSEEGRLGQHRRHQRGARARQESGRRGAAARHASRRGCRRRRRCGCGSGPTSRRSTGFAAFAGHIYSPWLKGRGGKGVACGLGAFLALAPACAGIAAAACVLVVAITRHRIARLAARRGVAHAVAVAVARAARLRRARRRSCSCSSCGGIARTSIACCIAARTSSSRVAASATASASAARRPGARRWRRRIRRSAACGVVDAEAVVVDGAIVEDRGDEEVGRRRRRCCRRAPSARRRRARTRARSPGRSAPLVCASQRHQLLGRHDLDVIASSAAAADTTRARARGSDPSASRRSRAPARRRRSSVGCPSSGAGLRCISHAATVTPTSPAAMPPSAAGTHAGSARSIAIDGVTDGARSRLARSSRGRPLPRRRRARRDLEPRGDRQLALRLRPMQRAHVGIAVQHVRGPRQRRLAGALDHGGARVAHRRADGLAVGEVAIELGGEQRRLPVDHFPLRADVVAHARGQKGVGEPEHLRVVSPSQAAVCPDWQALPKTIIGIGRPPPSLTISSAVSLPSASVQPLVARLARRRSRRARRSARRRSPSSSAARTRDRAPSTGAPCTVGVLLQLVDDRLALGAHLGQIALADRPAITSTRMGVPTVRRSSPRRGCRVATMRPIDRRRQRNCVPSNISSHGTATSASSSSSVQRVAARRARACSSAGTSVRHSVSPWCFRSSRFLLRQRARAVAARQHVDDGARRRRRRRRVVGQRVLARQGLAGEGHRQRRAGNRQREPHALHSRACRPSAPTPGRRRAPRAAAP